MNQCGCRDQRVTVIAWIRHMQARAAQRYGTIYYQDAIGKIRKNMAIYPGAQHRSLKCITTFHLQCSLLQFQHGNNGQKHGFHGNTVGPSRDLAISLA